MYTAAKGSKKSAICQTFEKFKWLKLPGWGLENGPSLAWVTPKHRKTNILATIPLKIKNKNSQYTFRLYLPSPKPWNNLKLQFF